MNYYYLLLIIPALLSLLAQRQVRRTHDKYNSQPNRAGLSGREAAGRLLASLGLEEVRLETLETPGGFTDHYDPGSKTLRLSLGIAEARSVTALGIVGHEVGHALQDKEGYGFLRFRNRMAAQLAVIGWVSPFVFIGGLLLRISLLLWVGMLMLAGMALFALISLPVEGNASFRARRLLADQGWIDRDEQQGVERVLRSAVFTYAANFGRRAAIFLFVAAAAGFGRG